MNNERLALREINRYKGRMKKRHRRALEKEDIDLAVAIKGFIQGIEYTLTTLKDWDKVK